MKLSAKMGHPGPCRTGGSFAWFFLKDSVALRPTSQRRDVGHPAPGWFERYGVEGRDFGAVRASLAHIFLSIIFYLGDLREC